MTRASDPAEWIDDAARSRPEHLFLRTPEGRELTYASLREQTGRFITALRGRGVVPGDRVAAQVEKSVEAVLLYVACLRMGAVFVPINVANTVNEVAYFLSDSRPRLAVIRPPEPAGPQFPSHLAAVPCVETLGTDGEGSLPDLVRQCGPEMTPPVTGGAESLAAIVYTSGTTGRSKGAMLTRGNLASNAAVLARAWDFTEGDVLLHTLPLFHVHGLFAALNTVLVSASSLLLLPKFDASQVLKWLPHVTVYMGVPTHYTRLLQEAALDRRATRNMRLFVSGSAPLLAETHAEFLQSTGHTILERYGMTETLMNTSNPYVGSRVAGSVGPPLPGVSVRVADALAAPDAKDSIGALEVEGPNVFVGYWGDAEKTRAAFTADGWFRTGDLGHIDGSGYVFIVGRAKDVVISGGYNVYPKEVELELDAVTGVLESAVFGVPHPDFGEGVTAVVVTRADTQVSEREMIEALKTRLAAYKLPKRILCVAELPRNTMGKVQKNVLREAYATLYEHVVSRKSGE